MEVVTNLRKPEVAVAVGFEERKICCPGAFFEGESRNVMMTFATVERSHLIDPRGRPPPGIRSSLGGGSFNNTNELLNIKIIKIKQFARMKCERQRHGKTGGPAGRSGFFRFRKSSCRSGIPGADRQGSMTPGAISLLSPSTVSSSASSASNSERFLMMESTM